MVEKPLKFGQYKLFLEPANEEMRVLILPDVPQNEKDQYLARVYGRSIKETTVKNMYSRWLLHVVTLVRKCFWSCFKGKVDVQVVAVNKEGRLYTPIAYSAVIESLTEGVIADSRNINEIRYLSVVKPDLGDQDLLVVFVQEEGKGLFKKALDTLEEIEGVLAIVTEGVKE